VCLTPQALRAGGALLVAIAWLPLGGSAGGAAPALALGEGWSNLFAGREAVFHVRVVPPVPSIAWELQAGERLLARQEVAVTRNPDLPGEATIRFQAPSVREGVGLALQLKVTTLSAGHQEASLARPLWVFGENPFVGGSAWLKGLDLRLFDPGDTIGPRWQQTGCPARLVRRLEAVAPTPPGTLVVGAGIAPARERGLWPSLLGLAGAGWRVLMLAPEAGAVELPGSQGTDLPVPQALSFRRADVIGELDKRLDSLAWPPDGRVVVASLLLTAPRGRVLAEVEPSASGWPWLEAEFASGGRLIVCGFALVEAWEVSPTPRYLLAAVLRHLARPGCAGGPPAASEGSHRDQRAAGPDDGN
jgi:hypothetical protein